MKREFHLACPHCGQLRKLHQDNIDDFYQAHVSRCLVGIASSMFNEIRVTGRILLRLFDPAGDLKDVRLTSNLVVDAGKALIIDRLQGVSGPPAVPDYQAIGTGSTAAAAGDTALGTEIGTRVQGALTQPTALTDRLISTFVAGNGTGAITESGRLNAATVGVLLARQVFSVVTKAAGDSLQIQHDIVIS